MIYKNFEVISLNKGQGRWKYNNIWGKKHVIQKTIVSYASNMGPSGRVVGELWLTKLSQATFEGISKQMGDRWLTEARR